VMASVGPCAKRPLQRVPLAATAWLRADGSGRLAHGPTLAITLPPTSATLLLSA
jgi:hypothetical protein